MLVWVLLPFSKDKGQLPLEQMKELTKIQTTRLVPTEMFHLLFVACFSLYMSNPRKAILTMILQNTYGHICIYMICIYIYIYLYYRTDFIIIYHTYSIWVIENILHHSGVRNCNTGILSHLFVHPWVVQDFFHQLVLDL